MKPKVIHQEAMEYSFKAKQALDQGNHNDAFVLYGKAAELESQVAKFYFDKPNLEPTRSIMIRSAAFLNIKAGLIEKAKQFIFFGLLNIKNEQILSELNNALEIAVSLGQMHHDDASKEFNYINLLRQRSVYYIIEPTLPVFGNSVSLEMIKDFSAEYLKSLKAFAFSKVKQFVKIGEEVVESFKKEIDNIVNPLVTNSGYGSFKFSIANDFLHREGEDPEMLDLKTDIVAKYHNEIFTNPLTEEDIIAIKKKLSEEEINDIFKPLAKIKANNSPYKVGYYDTNDFSKKFASKIINKQRQQLLTVKPMTQEDIGELENSIIHKRSSLNGKVYTTTIFRQQMRSAELNFKIDQIEPTHHASLILNEEIILDLNFNSTTGFTFSYPDFNVEFTGVEFNTALKGFNNIFYDKLRRIANSEARTDEEQSDWEVVKKLIGNPNALKEA